MVSLQMDAGHISADGLAFSAYVRMGPNRLTRLHRSEARVGFGFDRESTGAQSLEVEFSNTEFLRFYDNVRNLEKLV
jgi:hypothetical protein